MRSFRLRAPLVVLSLATLVVSLEADRAGAVTTPCAREASFDTGDEADLAIGVPGETIDGDPDAGAVGVLYGAAGGFGTNDELWHQDSTGIIGATEPADAFGSAVVKGDFDQDLYADLAIGAPDEDDGAGAVHVLYGSPTGLSATGSQLITQASGDISGSREAGDGFGAALAAGDFDDDGDDDLAIGVPGETIGDDVQAGLVVIVHGDSPNGLRMTGSDTIVQGTNGVGGAAEDFDRFGLALAACDFDNASGADLAIGSDESLDGATRAGKVDVLFGPGLDGPGLTLTQDVPESGDGFGSAIAAGDFDGDGRGDLAVGAPGENLDGNVDQGLVHVFASEPSNPLATETLWHQSRGTMAGTGGASEYFGFALATGDFNADGEDELAVGVPGDFESKGSIALLYGTMSDGITEAGNTLLWQGASGVPGVAERGDHWGSAVHMLDANADGSADLVAGAAEENVGRLVDAGLITVIYGDGGPADEQIHQDSSGIASVAERDDLFGFALG